MRRVSGLVLVFGLFAGVLVSGPGAQADFHPVCAGVVTGYATVGLRSNEDGSEMTFSGHVNCPGAGSIEIQSVTVDTVPSDGGPLGTTSATCEDPTGPCSASGTIDPADTGTYEVEMVFSVFGPDESFTDVSRLGRWEWAGAGQPVPTCVPDGESGMSLGPGCP